MEDIFIRSYLEYKTSQETEVRNQKNEAKTKAVSFFCKKFPDLYNKLTTLGYTIEAGDAALNDGQIECDDIYICYHILIKKKGDTASNAPFFFPIYAMHCKEATGMDFDSSSYVGFIRNGEVVPYEGIPEETAIKIGRIFATRGCSSPKKSIGKSSVSRDKLAAMAMAGILSGSQVSIEQPFMETIVAQYAYSIADEMLKQREK